MWPSLPNQNSAICVSSSPLPGIGSPMTTSKARQAVAGDHQDAVVADGVVVAHLAAREQRQRSEGGWCCEGSGHAARLGNEQTGAVAREAAAIIADASSVHDLRQLALGVALGDLASGCGLDLAAWPSQPNCR